MRFLATAGGACRGATSAVLLTGLSAFAWFAQGPPAQREMGTPGSRTELESESGRGMAHKWAVQSVWLEQGFDSTELRLRLENATRHYLGDSYFYAEIFDGGGRFCFSALFRLRENLGLDRGPLEPGGERTLVSMSLNLAIPGSASTIRVYPAHRRSVRSGEVLTAPVPIRIPARKLATTVPLPIPDWARLRLGPNLNQNDAPVVDLALALADVDEGGRLTAMHVLNAWSDGVRHWLENLGPRLVFSPSMQDFVPRRGQAAILVRAGPLRAFREGEEFFDPDESPWVRRFVFTVQGNEILPVSLLMLSPCRDIQPGVGGAGYFGPAIPDCFQYNGSGTDWSLEVWKPPFLP